MPATFTRTGVAYKQDGSQVATGIPRYETGKYGQAIMVEEGTTNLALWSQEFDNVYWTKLESTITANATTAPDGTATADKLVETAQIAEHAVYKSLLLGATAGAISVFAKAAGRSWMRFYLGASGYAYFDLGNGVLGTITGARASIISVGDGWYRCSVSLDAADTTDYVNITIADANGSTSYLGDVTKGIYIWGAQSEAKAYPTSYMATTTASVTRNAETLTIPTAGVLSGTAGTVEMWVNLLRAPGTTQWLLDTNTSGRFRLYATTAGAVKLEFIDSGSVARNITSSTGLNVAGTWFHVAVAWDSSGVHLYREGVLAATTANILKSDAWSDAAPPHLGSTNASAGHVDGLIDDLRISNTAHSAAKILADFTAGPAQYE